MELNIKRPDQVVPSYSLTGDLLSYLRCRLQYRYHNGSALPPSRPVQLWFGEFLHGTLELAYRFWRENSAAFPLPWPCTQREWQSHEPDWQENDIGRMANIVEASLRQQGKQARSTQARNSAYQRVEAAINNLAPHLFPLISSAESKVIGSRDIPESQMDLRSNKYEIHGIIDVLTNITLGQAADDNIISQMVAEACPDLEGDYEVIVDYKGSSRPLVPEPYWVQGNWQVQTYAWLRQKQPDSLPVAAGILIYINELTPGNEEMQNLRSGIQEGTTDVIPQEGSRDEQLIRMWRNGQDTSQISLDFRLARAIRIMPITPESIDQSLNAFDEVVRKIEEDIFDEVEVGNILNAWAPNCNDEATCVACDFRYFCPHPVWAGEDYTPRAPNAP